MLNVTHFYWNTCNFLTTLLHNSVVKCKSVVSYIHSRRSRRPSGLWKICSTRINNLQWFLYGELLWDSALLCGDWLVAMRLNNNKSVVIKFDHCVYAHVVKWHKHTRPEKKWLTFTISVIVYYTWSSIWVQTCNAKKFNKTQPQHLKWR